MPNKPQIKVLTNTSVDVLNAIRNSATINYKDYVPIATPNAESIKEIGATIMDYPALQNEFLSALINRIGRVVVTSKLYDNPIAMFKKGFLEFGESVEEIFVTLAKPFQFDPEVAENEVFKRQIPDVKSAFHVMNYQKFYKVTISQDQLRQAFLSWEGITDLIAKITEQIYTSANYDEFLVMKYMLARRILNGQINVRTFDTTKPMTSLAKAFKTVSNEMEFMSPKFNVARVRTHALKDEQYLLISAKYDAEMDVDVLAMAFNMDKAEFLGHRVLIDSFGTLDNERLAILFADDTTYKEITPEEAEALDEIPAVIVDKDYFMVFDNLNQFTENYNGQGLYWNYFYHVWKTFSISPFANGVAFISGEPTITSITVTQTGNTYFKDGVDDGKIFYLEADVDGTGLGIDKRVTWSVDESTVGDNVTATITDTGTLTVRRSEHHGSYTGIKVYATSMADGTIVGEYTTA